MMIRVRSPFNILQLPRPGGACTTEVLIKEFSPWLSMCTAMPESWNRSPKRNSGQCLVSLTRNSIFAYPMKSS